MKLLIFYTMFFAGIWQIQSQRLETYQNTALENNPSISSMQANVDIAKERINEANSLPDTEFGVGYFVSEPETRTGAQKAKITIRQMLPWFGTISAREAYAGSSANIEEIKLEIARRKLKLQVSESYFGLYELKQKMKILEQNIELLEVYRTMALNAVEVGKASAVEVLRLKMRQNDLTEKRRTLELQIETITNTFNNLLNEPESNQIAVKDTLMLPEYDAETNNLTLHPELLQYDEFSKSIENSEIVNQQEAFPKIGFGLDYISVRERQDMEVPDNGKDILMPTVSVAIPIFNKKYRSISRQNDLKQQQIEADRISRLNELETLLREALNKRASARIKIETQQENLQQATDAEDLLLKQYETGTIDFDDLLDIQELQLQIQMAFLEAVTSYFKQNAMLTYLTVKTQ